MISNLLSDDYLTDEIKYQIQTLDKSTQTPYEKGTQTDSLDKATQKDFKPEHHDLYPHLYIIKLTLFLNTRLIIKI